MDLKKTMEVLKEMNDNIENWRNMAEEMNKHKYESDVKKSLFLVKSLCNNNCILIKNVFDVAKLGFDVDGRNGDIGKIVRIPLVYDNKPLFVRSINCNSGSVMKKFGGSCSDLVSSVNVFFNDIDNMLLGLDEYIKKIVDNVCEGNVEGEIEKCVKRLVMEMGVGDFDKVKYLNKIKVVNPNPVDKSYKIEAKIPFLENGKSGLQIDDRMG